MELHPIEQMRAQAIYTSVDFDPDRNAFPRSEMLLLRVKTVQSVGCVCARENEFSVACQMNCVSRLKLSPKGMVSLSEIQQQFDRLNISYEQYDHIVYMGSFSGTVQWNHFLAIATSTFAKVGRLSPRDEFASTCFLVEHHGNINETV